MKDQMFITAVADDLLDRANRSRLIPSPMLTMGLLVQPTILRSLAEDDRLKENGFLARFLFVIPEQMTGKCLLPVDPPSITATGIPYNALVKSIFDLPRQHDENNPGQRAMIYLDEEAAEVNRHFFNEIERRRGPDGDLSNLAAWASKLRGNVVRIAGLLHVVDTVQYGAKPWEYRVSGETMANAWTIGYYLVPHAKEAFNEMRSDTTQALAKRILAWICRTFDNIQAPAFDLSTCRRAHSGNSKDEVEQALVRLQEHGYVRLQLPPARKPGQRGRASAAEYGIHPSVLKK